jgi:hypothetical protein
MYVATIRLGRISVFASPHLARACCPAARKRFQRALFLLPVLGACAGLGGCGESSDPRIPAVVRGTPSPESGAPAPQAAVSAISPNVNAPARDGLAPPVMHPVD